MVNKTQARDLFFIGLGIIVCAESIYHMYFPDFLLGLFSLGFGVIEYRYEERSKQKFYKEMREGIERLKSKGINEVPGYGKSGDIEMIVMGTVIIVLSIYVSTIVGLLAGIVFLYSGISGYRTDLKEEKYDKEHEK